MPNKEDEFYQRLLATFKVEAEEHLQTISDGLLALEKIEALSIKLSSLKPSFGRPTVLKVQPGQSICGK